MLECQIEALSGTREIIQREQRQLSAELANLKAHLVGWAGGQLTQQVSTARSVSSACLAVMPAAC
jgi:hypothetical protein